MEALLAHPDIDLNVKDVDGDTALSWATKSGRPEFIVLLENHIAASEVVATEDLPVRPKPPQGESVMACMMRTGGTGDSSEGDTYDCPGSWS